MKNIIQFSGFNPEAAQDKDDFCGAAGFMFESGASTKPTLPESPEDSLELYAFEQKIMDRLRALLSLEGKQEASVSFQEPEALRDEFKKVLLKVLARNKKAAHRSRQVLTVSHPEMNVGEQVPFLKERSEVPLVTLRRAATEELQMMHSLAKVFPELQDARNAIKSVKTETPSLYLF